MDRVISTAPSNVSLDALANGEIERLVWLTGNNFSGRSAILHDACDRYADRPGSAIYIPPELHNAISGLVPTVNEEILLHLGRCKRKDHYWNLTKEWGLQTFANRDPFTLSGGEQSLLVILCKLALEPKLLAMDGALEQLDSDNSRRILSLVCSAGSAPMLPQILLTHNGCLPEKFSANIHHLSASTFKDVVRMDPPPPLDASRFDPPQVREPASVVLQDLAFHYPHGATVFHKLNLRLEPGRIYRLAGPNGCGKSTLARLLTGVLRPGHGRILLNGKRFNSYARPGTLARLHFQSPDSQLFESTVRDELKSLPAPTALAAARFAGLEGFLEQHPFDLPFVLRKRLALTLVFHTSAPWLIFDEPTLGQDETTRTALGHSLRKLAIAGHGIILISHNSEFAQSFSDEELNLGKIANG